MHKLHVVTHIIKRLRHLQNHTTLKPHFQLKFRSLLYRKTRKLYMYLVDTFWKYISATDSISYF